MSLFGTVRPKVADYDIQFCNMIGTTVIAVGKPETSFEVHTELLNKASTYFKDAQSTKMVLPGRHTATTFNIFTQWLYHQPNITATTTFDENCFDAYLLGKALQAPVFTALCEGHIKILILNGSLKLSPSHLQDVLSSTDETDPIRCTILNHFAGKVLDGECGDLRQDEQISEGTWKELCAAVATEAASRKRKNASASSQSTGFGSAPQNISPFGMASARSTGSASGGSGPITAFGPSAHHDTSRASVFGNTNTQSHSSGALFGGASNNNNNNNNNTPSGGFNLERLRTSAVPFASASSNTEGSLFSQTPSNTAQRGHFGSGSGNQNSSGSLFGNTCLNTQPRNLFEASNTSGQASGGLSVNATTSTTTGGGLFGSSSSTTRQGGLFENVQSRQTSDGRLFGNPSNTARPGDLFGKSNTGNQPTGGLFGQTRNGSGLLGNTFNANTGTGHSGNGSNQASSGSPFGCSINNNNQLSSGLFGNTQTTSGGGPFGNARPAQGGLFSNPSTQTPQCGGVFGNTNSTVQGLFGNSTTQGQRPGGLFGSAPAPPTGGLFGNAQNSSGGFGWNSRSVQVDIPHTTHAVFAPFRERDQSGNVVSEYQSVAFQPGYQMFSPEELRYADYIAGISTIPHTTSTPNRAASEAKEATLKTVLAQVPLEHPDMSRRSGPPPGSATVSASGQPAGRGAISETLGQRQGQTDQAQVMKDLQARVAKMGEALTTMKIDIQMHGKDKKDKMPNETEAKDKPQANTTGENTGGGDKKASDKTAKEEQQERPSATFATTTTSAPGTGMSSPEIIFTPNTSRTQSIEPITATIAIPRNPFHASVADSDFDNDEDED